MTGAWTVFRKELVDALRDRRTLMTVLLSAVAMGPLVLMLISTLVARVEKQAEAREVVVQGIAQAPTLRNYLERQTYTVREAPADYEQQLAQSRLGDPVVVVPKDFEADLRQGERRIGAQGLVERARRFDPAIGMQIREALVVELLRLGRARGHRVVRAPDALTQAETLSTNDVPTATRTLAPLPAPT